MITSIPMNYVYYVDIFDKGLELFDIPREKWDMRDLCVDAISIKAALESHAETFFWSMHKECGSTRFDTVSADYVMMSWEESDRVGLRIVLNYTTHQIEFYKM